MQKKWTKAGLPKFEEDMRCVVCEGFSVIILGRGVILIRGFYLLTYYLLTSKPHQKHFWECKNSLGCYLVLLLICLQLSSWRFKCKWPQKLLPKTAQQWAVWSMVPLGVASEDAVSWWWRSSGGKGVCFQFGCCWGGGVDCVCEGVCLL